MDSKTRTVLIRVTGKVQGVFYRASAQEQAEALGLSGWVRNCPDGSVEALVSGTEDQVAAFIAWCRRGPEKAQVQEVQVSDFQGAVPAGGFRIRR
ncbi:acylphosphatase [Flaviaesturariibacter flavus]|uniref:acylphosphatase n=1 Tax=Flaviaesturariibacter flavus TaxID=2502780 RepID=A0A4R1B4N3_9BACT|nr:acylphosphatase [Flaviaesturariibacter flavus]TCJ12430.1 acylphosphatase [Flaviaesturariibacter flavus]